MNYMKEVAQMLGVELGEEFKIKHDHFKYKITEKGLERFDSYDNRWYLVAPTLVELLLGDSKIIKLPKPILDDAEKEYLSNVIKPFRNRVLYIKKEPYTLGENDFEFIRLRYRDIDTKTIGLLFPMFKKGTMYKGMELDKEYSVDELGL